MHTTCCITSHCDPKITEALLDYTHSIKMKLTLTLPIKLLIIQNKLLVIL